MITVMLGMVEGDQPCGRVSVAVHSQRLLGMDADLMCKIRRMRTCHTIEISTS